LRENHFGHSVPERAVVVYFSEPQVFVWQMVQAS
jgi:hypothetical protein